MDKVKLIKEIKNYVQGINLVQVSPPGPLPGRAGCPGLPSDLALPPAGKEAGGVSAPGNQSQRRQGRGGEDQGGPGGRGRHRGSGVGRPRDLWTGVPGTRARPRCSPNAQAASEEALEQNSGWQLRSGTRSWTYGGGRGRRACESRRPDSGPGPHAPCPGGR